MNRALMADAHPDFTFRTVPNGNHWCYASIYTDADFWRWMFRHHRKGSADRKMSWPDNALAADEIHNLRGNPTTMPTGGGVLCLYWRDLPGNTIKQLTDDPAYPNFPVEQVYYDQMEIPANQPPLFASVLHGWVHPPVTGDYRFYIASDNQGELWLSSDASAEKRRRLPRCQPGACRAIGSTTRTKNPNRFTCLPASSITLKPAKKRRGR